MKTLTSQKGISIRSLSVPSEKVIWASASKGMVAKSINEGTSFEWMQVKGYEKRDFRAMHAWNDQEAIIVAVASPAIILKTIDGGASWDKVYENNDTSMFLDAIHFSDNNSGTVIGDPIDGHLFILTTNNKGTTWDKMPNDFFKSTLNKGEAFFASSNSNLYKDYKGNPYSGPAVSAALLKAISIEETDLGWKTSNDVSSAEGVMQVLEDTLVTLNKRRGWMRLSPYAQSALESNPSMSIQIAAEIIIKHMLAPEFKLSDGVRNVGGFGYTIDEMLSAYKSGEDGPRYARRVRVYERFINEIIGGV
jgi:hypothetical protein